MNNKITFSFIDLFAGIGGFRMALDKLGGICLNYSEINKDAINTYCTNFNDSIDSNLGDITKIKSLPNHDLLTAGVPCQSWSIAGKKLGFADDRGQLWNDTIYLLNQSRPKAFIFENVKGLVDPRNKEALEYILNRIREAGYFANIYVINSYDYGVPQNRIRIYIIGFSEEKYSLKFKLPLPIINKVKLIDIIEGVTFDKVIANNYDKISNKKSMSLSNNNGLNDYFLFNDLRNGHSTIHSWDILETTSKQKHICYLLLKNRRKSAYGHLDGNPLSLKHFKDLDSSILKSELNDLVKIGILKEEEYTFIVNKFKISELSNDELEVVQCAKNNLLIIDELYTLQLFKIKKLNISPIIKLLKEKKIIECIEKRYDFKNTKISTGLFGINRIFLPTSNIFPTLVASDTNDYISTINIKADNEEEYKRIFLEEVYKKGNYRKITKEEACLIQGFPKKYLLPENRSRWMKLLGNSVSVPVIEMLTNSIIQTGIFSPVKSKKSLA